MEAISKQINHFISLPHFLCLNSPLKPIQNNPSFYKTAKSKQIKLTAFFTRFMLERITVEAKNVAKEKRCF